jgi:asparagine synthase (glutamine-hydrolysing)
MCAINGFNFKDEALVQKMVERTRHRGPDQEGYFCDEGVSLGNARLSIIDLSQRGRQPIWNEDKSICIVLNGEIYNFKELRRKLEGRGHTFYSDTDTEAVVHMYEDHGHKCLDFLNGIFAFAIWDRNKKEIFVARDRVGVKPLYYYFDGKRFIFSSEAKAIFEHPVEREIEKKAILTYFKLSYVPGSLTLFKGILRLPPAHYLVYSEGKVNTHRYWDLEDAPEVSSQKQALEEVRDIVRDSVHRQLISDRPVGIFLSGGIDSTAVLGVASEYSSGRVKTYSVGFAGSIDEDKFNRDFYLAKKTSEFYKTDHHELFMSDRDALNALEPAVFHMDEPIANPTQLPTFLLSQEAKKSVAVVLGGDGGDEIFGGYARYYYSRLIDRYQLILPGILRRMVPLPLIEYFLHKKDLALRLHIPQSLGRYLIFMSEKDCALREVLNMDVPEGIGRESFLYEHFPQNKFRDFSKYLMYLDFSKWLPDESLLRSDKMTMAHGLEERVPLLDHRLVELAFRIPTKWKVRGKKNSKWIFREAMKQYVPAHILNRDKRGWFSPAYCADTQEYLNFLGARKMLDDHISRKRYNMHILWSLMIFQVWYKTFIRA